MNIKTVEKSLEVIQRYFDKYDDSEINITSTMLYERTLTIEAKRGYEKIKVEVSSNV